MNNANPFSKFQSISDTEWLSLLHRSIAERTINGVAFPGFPDPALQNQTVGSANEHALHEAFRFYVYAKQVLQRNNLAFSDSFRMIDFGMCWGRISRFFLRDVTPGNIVGLEVNDTFIEAAKSIGMPVDIQKIEPLGPTLLPADSVDLVTAYSVFSHLDEVAADAWAEEFSRVLKPGGILIATTEGERFIDFCAELASREHHESDWHRSLSKAFPDPEAARRRYLAGECVTSEPYRHQPHYGETLIPPGYIMSAWGDRLELLEFSQAGQRFWQGVFVLRKRTEPVLLGPV